MKARTRSKARSIRGAEYALDYAALSDPLLRAALWAGFAAIILAMLLLVYIVVLRLVLIENRHREERFVARWRPLMLAAIANAPEAPPALARSEHHSFLRLWNHFQESLRGESKLRLNE